jgi:hypothetical protein
LRRFPKPPAALTLLALLPLFACALPLASCTGFGKPNQPSTELAFGVDMARRGLWSEALFRFHQAEKDDPQNPRVQNNLGVAYEAQGDFDSALAHYKRALQLAPENREVRANYARFVEFYQAYKAPEKSGKGKGGILPIPKTAPPAGGKPAGSPGQQPPEADPRGKQAPPPANPRPGTPEPSNLPPTPAGGPGASGPRAAPGLPGAVTPPPTDQPPPPPADSPPPPPAAQPTLPTRATAPAVRR